MSIYRIFLMFLFTANFELAKRGTRPHITPDFLHAPVDPEQLDTRQSVPPISAQLAHHRIAAIDHPPPNSTRSEYKFIFQIRPGLKFEEFLFSCPCLGCGVATTFNYGLCPSVGETKDDISLLEKVFFNFTDQSEEDKGRDGAFQTWLDMNLFRQ